jgi:hypothetical protein
VVRSKWTTILGILIASSTIARSEPRRYVCYGEHTVGLQYNSGTGTWNDQAVVHHKYIFRQLTEADRDPEKGKWRALLNKHPEANWAFFDFGKPDSMPLSDCEDTNSVFAQDIVCHRIIDDAAFSKDSRRFELSYHGSYITQGFWQQLREENPESYELLLSQGKAKDPSKPDDLFIEIGGCKPSEGS